MMDFQIKIKLMQMLLRKPVRPLLRHRHVQGQGSSAAKQSAFGGPSRTSPDHRVIGLDIMQRKLKHTEFSDKVMACKINFQHSQA